MPLPTWHSCETLLPHTATLVEDYLLIWSYGNLIQLNTIDLIDFISLVYFVLLETVLRHHVPIFSFPTASAAPSQVLWASMNDWLFLHSSVVLSYGIGTTLETRSIDPKLLIALDLALALEAAPLILGQALGLHARPAGGSNT